MDSEKRNARVVSTEERIPASDSLNPVKGAHWATTRERGSLFLLRCITGAYKAIGRRVAFLLLYPITVYFFIFGKTSRRSSFEYLRKVYAIRGRPLRGFALMLESYLHFVEFSRMMLDKFSVWHGDIPAQSVGFHGYEDVREWKKTGRGAVLLSAHFGNIEVLRALSKEFHNATINALMFTAHNPGFMAVLRDVNPQSMLRIIQSETVGPELVLNLQERLARGEFVAMLADRVMPRSPEKKTVVSFLGAAADFPSGPFLLASFLECPVFLVFCVRDPSGQYQTFFERFSDRVELPRKSRTEVLNALVQRFAGRLEAYAVRFPRQWFNFYPFWQASARTDDRRAEMERAA